MSGHRFVAFLQNHDQLGNRAQGERISHLAGLERAKIGAALMLLSPYVPMLFQGEEWAASSPFQYFVDFHDDPALAEAVRTGRTHEFGSFGWKPEDVPDPTAESTLVNSRLKWAEIEQPAHREMLDWYRALIRLRRDVPEFTSGQLDRIHVRFDAEESWLVVDRDGVVIVCNLSASGRQIPVDGRDRPILLTSKAEVSWADGGISVPGDCVAVLGRAPEPRME